MGLGAELSTEVADLMLRQPLFVAPTDTVADAARAMGRSLTSSALVQGDPVGILTSGDLRDRVVAARLPADTPVGSVMTHPVQTLPADSPLYAALLLMLEHGFEHVPVTREDRVVGVVTQKDMLRFQARSPMMLLGRIRTVDDVADLSGYGDEVVATVRALRADGVEAVSIARIVSSLNDALSGRLLQLARQRLGEPPCPFTWLALGSEGREEMVLLTDQDNALVYRDDSAQAASYFGELARTVVTGLAHAGLTPCPGGYTAATWCHALARWRDVFISWVDRPDPEALLGAAVFLDFRPVHGTVSVQVLRDVMVEARRAPAFLAALAQTAGRFAPPLRLFGRVGTDGGLLDLKQSGLAAIVNLARLFAVEAASAERSTLNRLRAAGQAGVISEQGAAELGEAFQYLIGLRLREQLRAPTISRPADNRIRYDDLTWLEQRRLRDAFRTVAQMQKATAFRLPGP